MAPEALEQLLLQARSHNGWLDKPVSQVQLHALYALTRQGPTSQNCTPARFVFAASDGAKTLIEPSLKPGNVRKVMSAPVVAVLAYDTQFLELMPRLFPAYDVATPLRSDPVAAMQMARDNAWLQGGYMILAARALGLDCGPIGGFSREVLDEALFPDGRWKSAFLCCLGYGDDTQLRPQGPRLAFEEACCLM